MPEQNERRGTWFRSRANVALLVFLGIIGYFLIMEHWPHVIQALPYLLILVCIVMHLFMHRGHGHGGNTDSSTPDWRWRSGDKHER